MLRITPLLASLLTALIALPAVAAPRQAHLGWQGSTETTMAASWRDDGPAGACEYGLTTAYGAVVESSAAPYAGDWLHHAEMTELAPGATYHYRCGVPGAWTPDRTFRTSPAPGEPFTFLAWGDSRSDATARRIVRAAAQAVDPAFSVFTGDLVEDGTQQWQWDQWFSDMEPIASVAPVMPILGNHERDASQYYDQFVLPTGAEGVSGYRPESFFSFKYAGVAFIGLSTEPLGSVGGPQYQWAERELAAAADDPDVDFIVVYGHRPPYSSGNNHGSSLDVREWVPLFEQYGVDVAFWGHDHHYERSWPLRDGVPVEEGGTTYYIVGGTGAPLRSVGSSAWTAFSRSVFHFVEVRVDGPLMTLEARDENGAVFDRAEILSRNPAAYEPDPGGTDPGAGESDGGTADGGASEPGQDPGAVTDGGTAGGGTADGGTAGPGTSEPGSGDAGAEGPGSGGTVEPGTGSGGTTDPATGAEAPAVEEPISGGCSVMGPAGATGLILLVPVALLFFRRRF